MKTSKAPTKEQMKASAYHFKFAEVKKLFIAAPNFRDRCFVKTLFWLGLRRHEACALDISDIDFERRRVTVIGKGNKRRTIPVIDEEFLNDLQHLIGESERGAVFLSNEGKRISLRTANDITERIGKLAGITNPNKRLAYVNPHIFRHSVARFLKSKGFSAEWIQNFLGHESYKTTMDMYGTISIDEMQEIADMKLGE